MRFIVLIVFCGCAFGLSAQSYISNQQPALYFNQAIAHYHSANYKVAKHLMDKFLVSTSTPEALYYRAMSTVKGEQKLNEYYIKNFLKEYPLHPLAHKAQFELAHHYFIRKNYQKAVLTYGIIDMNSLDSQQQEQAYFEKGYSLVQMKVAEQGIESLKLANGFGGEYTHVSAYYLGVMSKNPEAEQWFLKASQSNEWKIKSAVYLSQIYLTSGEYDKLINQNHLLLSSDKTKENHELYFYTGEAYYQQKKYRQAVRYFQDGIALKVKPPTAETLFKVGHSFYEMGEKDMAVEQLKKSGLNESPTGQASAFQLGKIYTEQGKYMFALHAFEISGASEHDSAVKEESKFMAAKINIQLEQFSKAIEQLERFTSEYSTSSRLNETNELLSTAYLNTSNYDLVIAHFERSNSTNPVLRQNYQKVTLLKGMQAFSDRQISEAMTYLTKSVNTPMKRSLEFEGYYWLGESYLVLGNLTKSKKSYLKARAIDKDKPLPEYGLGYLLYNEKKYEEAKSYFQAFRRKAGSGHPFSLDASIRIADCDYALKNYDDALSGYHSLKGRGVAQDYLFYQIGLIHQLNGRTREAIASYQKIIGMNNSTYRNNALFQSAVSYFENANFTESEKIFTNYLDQYPDENLAPYARIKRGLGYFNQSKNGKAKKDYLYVLDNHIRHPAAQNALLGIQELQKQGEKIDFKKYLASYREAHPDDSSLESIEFEQAKNLYFSQNYSKAISQFEALLKKKSGDAFKEDIIYYLADANHRNGNLTAADNYYVQIIAMAPSGHLNRSLDKRGRLLLETKQGAKAIENYHLLAEHSMNRKEAYLANEGLMKANFQTQKWDASIRAARAIVHADWKPSNAENQAALFIGKCLSNKAEYSAAEDEFLKVLNGGADELAAEAKYRIAEMQFLQDQNQPSLATLFQLNSNYAAYQNWVGKSFLLIADNYLKMNELLQAKATLNSLVENFPNEKIKRQAQIKLTEIDELQLEEVKNDTLK